MTDHIPANAANTGPRTGFGRTIGAGVVAGILLFGALGGWAVQASISGAIIAQGEVKVHGKPQEVQHLDGGLIAGIAVSDGDRVEAGALLLRLDPTTLSLQRDNARARLAATLARAARGRSPRRPRKLSARSSLAKIHGRTVTCLRPLVGIVR